MTKRHPYRSAIENVVATILLAEAELAEGDAELTATDLIARLRTGIVIGAYGNDGNGPMPFEPSPPPHNVRWDGYFDLWAGIEIPSVPRGGIRYDVPLRVERDEPEKVYNLDDGSVVPLRNQGGKVIGVASVNDDGTVEMTVTDPDAKAALQADLGHYSVPNPFIPESHREALRARGFIPPLGSFDEGIKDALLKAETVEPHTSLPRAEPYWEQMLREAVAAEPAHSRGIITEVLTDAGFPPSEHGGIAETVRLLVGHLREANRYRRDTPPRCQHYWHRQDADRCVRPSGHAPPHYFEQTGPEPDWRVPGDPKENPDARD